MFYLLLVPVWPNRKADHDRPRSVVSLAPPARYQVSKSSTMFVEVQLVRGGYATHRPATLAQRRRTDAIDLWCWLAWWLESCHFNYATSSCRQLWRTNLESSMRFHPETQFPPPSLPTHTPNTIVHQVSDQLLDLRTW